MTRSLALPTAAIVLVCGLGGARALPSASPAAAEGPHAIPAHALPVSMSHRYRMTGRIRPLLFWISRDRVGFAQVTWRRSGDRARGYELLVGTDPATAPRRINRWGYIAEESGPDEGTLLAMMSGAEESSLEEAKAAVDRDSHGAEFKALWSRLGSGLVISRAARVQTADAPTIHDVGWLLERVRVETSQAPARERSIEGGIRPGFLCAVAELVQSGVAPASGAPPGATVVRYAFGQRVYELRIRETTQLGRAATPYAVPSRRTIFEIRNPTTETRTRFEMIYGLEGDLAGVPFVVAWQPRWWLKVELHLEAAADDGRVARVGVPH